MAVILLQRQTLTVLPNLHTRALTRRIQINHFCQIECTLQAALGRLTAPLSLEQVGKAFKSL
jgi:hypothetical protein